MTTSRSDRQVARYSVKQDVETGYFTDNTHELKRPHQVKVRPNQGKDANDLATHRRPV
jgi:hypothetical protein